MLKAAGQAVNSVITGLKILTRLTEKRVGIRVISGLVRISRPLLMQTLTHLVLQKLPAPCLLGLRTNAIP